MKNLTQKFSKHFFGVGVRVVTLALFLIIFTAGTALAQTKAYVSNANDSFISVIDTSTQTVVSNIPVGGFPDGLAVTPNGQFIYVKNRSNGTVQVISTATEQIVASVPVGGSQGPIEISPNGALACYGDISGTVSVINTATNTLAAAIPTAAFSITSMAFTSNSASVYVGSLAGDLIIIDTATNQVVCNCELWYRLSIWRVRSGCSDHAGWGFGLRGRGFSLSHHLRSYLNTKHGD